MQIYLCQIRERQDRTLYVHRNTEASTDDDYIAISHVWGSPETIQLAKVDGIDGDVSLSPAKLSILEILHRPDVCGNDWFWMDLFCLDQTPNAKISMTEQLASIPTVYKSSRCVKVLIESPVCREWAELAIKVAKNPDMDIETFNESELMHARKCRYMLFADPWFDRLWTRQEGLYATNLQMVLLDKRDCPRLSIIHTQGQKWKFAGMSAMQRKSSKTFLNDKLHYHGHVITTSALRFQIYVDLVYRGTLDMSKYEPLPSNDKAPYSPIDSAWRSGRTTTKARDYVLAVFPDIAGYQVPPNERSLSFANLLHNALQQLPNLQLLDILAAKVTQGTIESESVGDGTIKPYAVQTPATVTEAFDTFSLVSRWATGYSDEEASEGHTLDLLVGPLRPVAQRLNLETIRFTRSYLPELLSLWDSTADVANQLLSCPPSSPCIGSSRILQNYEDMHYRAFASRFCKSSIEKWAADRTRLVAHGVVDLDKMASVTNEDFELYLTRFMACLICGSTLENGLKIAEATEMKLVSTSRGQTLLGLINKKYLQAFDPSKFILLSRGLTKLEGLHIGIESEHDGSWKVVGRTWIPRDGYI